MGMTYADNFYDHNCDKVFEKVSDINGKFSDDDFQREMSKLKDERLNELWKENEELKECVEFYADNDNWDLVPMRSDGEGGCAPIFCDDYSKARACLESTSKLNPA